MKPQSLQISHVLRKNGSALRAKIRAAFDAVAGHTKEVDFVKAFATEAGKVLQNYTVGGVRFRSHHKVIHHKPIVTFKGTSRELGDLLIVVKYRSTGAWEAKAIIYQVKLSDSKNQWTYKIDQGQLELLTTWPSFSFGRNPAGTPISYHIKPTTLECGSYMLEPRSRAQLVGLPGEPFGRCPYARMVRDFGPEKVNSKLLPSTSNDVNTFLRHLTFQIGEPHGSPGVQDLVDALYRLVGLKKDPPAEFDGYLTEEGQGAFAVLEIDAGPEGEDNVRTPPPRPVTVKQVLPDPVKHKQHEDETTLIVPHDREQMELA